LAGARIPMTVDTLRSDVAQNVVAQLLAVRSLLDEAVFAFEVCEAMVQGVDMFAQSTRGFSDWLIVPDTPAMGVESPQHAQLPGTS
jgi:hypothetical protein